jgi:hypothetical protein
MPLFDQKQSVIEILQNIKMAEVLPPLRLIQRVERISQSARLYLRGPNSTQVVISIVLCF